MKTLIVVVVLALTLATPTFSRTMDRCSVAQEMYDLGVPKDELPIWTCIAEHESSYRTHVKGKKNTNGSQDFGLFQINNKWWCVEQGGIASYNECKVNCEELLSDKIDKSVKCAQQVKKQQGWTAWAVWKYCNGTLPSIDECFPGDSTCY